MIPVVINPSYKYRKSREIKSNLSEFYPEASYIFLIAKKAVSLMGSGKL